MGRLVGFPDLFGSRKKVRPTFCEQKVAKKLFYAGSWALAATQPVAQHNKSFCGAFFKKRLLSFT
jgi:hypothetical protein